MILRIYWNGYGLLALTLICVGCGSSDDGVELRTDGTKASSVTPYTAQVVLQPSEEARILRPEISANSVLEHPRSLHVDKRGVMWAHTKPPIVAFDLSGRFIRAFGAPGKGPGELSRIDAFVVGQDGSSYAYDAVSQRVSIFDSTYGFVTSYTVGAGMLRNIAVNPQGILYLLREAYFMEESSVHAYDPQGTLLHSWGHIPFSARVQLNLVGGGIEVDTEGNVYYGYVSDHKVFKTDSSGNMLAVFDSEPSYYVGPDEEKLRSFDESQVMERLEYFYGLSRMRALYLARGTPFLFQQFLTPDYEEQRMKLSLEIWHTDGFKIASDIKSPGTLRFADRHFLYFVDSTEDVNLNPHIRMHSYVLERNEFVAF